MSFIQNIFAQPKKTGYQAFLDGNSSPASTPKSGRSSPFRLTRRSPTTTNFAPSAASGSGVSTSDHAPQDTGAAFDAILATLRKNGNSDSIHQRITSRLMKEIVQSFKDIHDATQTPADKKKVLASVLKLSSGSGHTGLTVPTNIAKRNVDNVYGQAALDVATILTTIPLGVSILGIPLAEGIKQKRHNLENQDREPVELATGFFRLAKKHALKHLKSNSSSLEQVLDSLHLHIAFHVQTMGAKNLWQFEVLSEILLQIDRLLKKSEVNTAFKSNFDHIIRFFAQRDFLPELLYKLTGSASICISTSRPTPSQWEDWLDYHKVLDEWTNSPEQKNAEIIQIFNFLGSDQMQSFMSLVEKNETTKASLPKSAQDKMRTMHHVTFNKLLEGLKKRPLHNASLASTSGSASLI